VRTGNVAASGRFTRAGDEHGRDNFVLDVRFPAGLASSINFRRREMAIIRAGRCPPGFHGTSDNVVGTGNPPHRFALMPRKLVKVEVVEEGDERYLRKVYADGTEEQVPIAKESRKKRAPLRPYWYWELRTGRRKFF
jgi:hypothetical protein